MKKLSYLNLPVKFLLSRRLSIYMEVGVFSFTNSTLMDMYDGVISITDVNICFKIYASSSGNCYKYSKIIMLGVFIYHFHWIIEKAREFPKNIYFCFIDYAKAFDLWITINCGKFWKRWEYQTTWPVSWESCMQVRKQQLELDMEQQTGSK